MSVGSNLQEMENVVTKGAKPAEPIQKLAGTTPGQAAVEDLGGPTPENYKTDDDSAKLKTPGASLKQVKDVVNKGAKAAEAVSDELEDGQEVVAEEPAKEEETTVSEEETSTDEVVAESEESTEEVIEEEQINVEEDINALVNSLELSEESQDKARTIFEAAINSKVSEIKEQLNVSYEEKLVEEVAVIKTELSERVDSYLEYVADEWIQENALAVENGLKTEMTDSFLTGMKSLFEEHYVQIPEDKYDVIESMVDKLDEMEGKLNEQIEKNVALNKRLSESTADGIFGDVTEGLADTQKDKLAALAEGIEFTTEEEFTKKVTTIKESYFKESTVTQSEVADETPVESSEDVTPAMATYLQALNRWK